MSFFKDLLGKNRQLNHEVLFGHQAASEGEHGAIVGTWIKEGHRRPITISFFFKGHIRPPKMTPELLDEIWFHAKTAGIDPTHLTSYDELAKPRGIRQPVVSPHRPVLRTASVSEVRPRAN